MSDDDAYDSWVCQWEWCGHVFNIINLFPRDVIHPRYDEC